MAEKSVREMTEPEVLAELEKLRGLPTPQDAAGFECRHETMFELQCRLADLQGKPRPTWSFKGVL